MFIRSAFNYDRREASDGIAKRFPGKSRTQQHQKDEADINVIVGRFIKTGHLPLVQRPPTFGDFSGVFDFQSAQNLIVRARESFMALSADVRKRFNNDAAAFVEFCTDDKNLDEMRKLGLAIPAAVSDDISKSAVPAVSSPPASV